LPVLLGAALKTPVPLVVLHLTRPLITIPDHAKPGIPSHFEAVKGAHVVRDNAPGKALDGAMVVQGTSAIAGIVKVLPEVETRGLNVKIVCGASPELFALQPEAYRKQVSAGRIGSSRRSSPLSRAGRCRTGRSTRGRASTP